MPDERDEDALIDLLVPAMRAKLAANRQKGGWRDDSYRDLFRGLENECIELFEAIDEGEPVEAVIAEAADVANFAAMIADRYRVLNTTR